MKMSKKILSVILAVLMAFSTFAVTLSASAAEEPVKPEYTENVTEEDIAELFEDVDTLLVNKVLTMPTVLSFSLTAYGPETPLRKGIQILKKYIVNIVGISALRQPR